MHPSSKAYLSSFFIVSCTHPLLFPLSAEAKRVNCLVYNDILPLLWFTREGGWGDEYV